jgi:hypothetical protein
MTISRRTAILRELAALDEQIIAARGPDHEQLLARQRSLEVELAGLVKGVDSGRSAHEWTRFGYGIRNARTTVCEGRNRLVLLTGGPRNHAPGRGAERPGSTPTLRGQR